MNERDGSNASLRNTLNRHMFVKAVVSTSTLENNIAARLISGLFPASHDGPAGTSGTNPTVPRHDHAPPRVVNNTACS